MKLKTIIDSLAHWITTTQTAAIRTLTPQAEDAGREIGRAVRAGLESGYMAGLMESPDSFAQQVIEVEAVKVDAKKARKK